MLQSTKARFQQQHSNTQINYRRKKMPNRTRTNKRYQPQSPRGMDNHKALIKQIPHIQVQHPSIASSSCTFPNDLPMHSPLQDLGLLIPYNQAWYTHTITLWYKLQNIQLRNDYRSLTTTILYKKAPSTSLHTTNKNTNNKEQEHKTNTN